MLISKLLWPLLIYEVNTNTRKWLALPLELTLLQNEQAVVTSKVCVGGVQGRKSKTRRHTMLLESLIRWYVTCSTNTISYKPMENTWECRHSKRGSWTEKKRHSTPEGDLVMVISSSGQRDVFISELRNTEDEKCIQSQQGHWTAWEGHCKDHKYGMIFGTWQLCNLVSLSNLHKISCLQAHTCSNEIKYPFCSDWQTLNMLFQQAE